MTIYDLEHTIAAQAKTITDLQAQLSASREMMECGHPKIFIKSLPADFANPQLGNVLRCAICAEIETKVNAALAAREQQRAVEIERIAAEVSVEAKLELEEERLRIQAERAVVLETVRSVRDILGKNITSCTVDFIIEKIEALISPTDRLALDKLIDAKVREARLAEAECPQRPDGKHCNCFYVQNRCCSCGSLRAVPAEPEDVCPTCTGTCAVIIGENEFNTCPDCHGTGKRTPEEKL